jgi:predicted acetyltransferase
MAGFWLIRFFNKHDLQLNDIGGFFIVRKFRYKGLGKLVAHTVFNLYPGHWQTRQMVENTPAHAVWR